MIDWLSREVEEYYIPVHTFRQNQNSEVQLIRHKTLHRALIKRTYTGSPEVYQTLLGIRHPNLPVVYEVAAEESRVFVLEEYIDGATIADVLRERVYTEDEVRRITSALCSALAALHTLGIIHRDVKPENVMVDKGGAVKLIDFNAAKFYKAYKASDTLVIGTTGFAAPEQFGIAQSDERTDLFSVGILMNVMLTGEHPSRRLYGGKPFAKIIRKCTQISPGSRYPDALSLARELR